MTREQNRSCDAYVRITDETPEKLLAEEGPARDYCATAPRPDADEGEGNTTGFVIYRIDYPTSGTPHRIARWDADTQQFD